MIYTWFFLVIFSLIYVVYSWENVHRRFEYKYSFKPPYLAQYDGSIPFFVYGGNAIASSDNLRLAPSLKSQKGAVWSKFPTNFEWWEVDFGFRITGRGRIGADGLAFWYTAHTGTFDGPVFGSSDKWVGLGVFFDSFDNDNKHNNPYIMAVVNNGTWNFDHSNDGASQMVGGCLRDFRNKPFSTRARIEYYKNTLTVIFYNGNTNNENDYEICVQAKDVYLPRYGYFGLSAATGGLADDHDVKYFTTHSIHPEGSLPGASKVGVAPEDAKLANEYAEYERKLETQKQQYQKEHPDSTEFSEWFETDSQRELRQIFTVQSQLYEAVQLLSQKLDETLGKQERSLTLLSAVTSAVGGGSPQHMDPNAAIRNQKLDSNVDSLMSTVYEVRNSILEIQRRTDAILQNQANQPSAQVQSLGYGADVMTEVRDSLNGLRKDVALATHTMKTTSPQSSSCISTTSFFVFIGFQVCLAAAYFIYKNRSESQAKKFY